MSLCIGGVNVWRSLLTDVVMASDRPLSPDVDAHEQLRRLARKRKCPWPAAASRTAGPGAAYSPAEVRAYPSFIWKHTMGIEEGEHISPELMQSLHTIERDWRERLQQDVLAMHSRLENLQRLLMFAWHLLERDTSENKHKLARVADYFARSVRDDITPDSHSLMHHAWQWVD